MGTIDPQIPQSGQPNSSEDLKIISGMGTIRDEINGNLDNDNIASGANINGSKLLAGSVGTTQLTDANVTTAKIAADAITNAKIADDAVQGENLSLTPATVTTSGTQALTGTFAGISGLSSATLVSGGIYLITADLHCSILAASTLQFDLVENLTPITDSSSYIAIDSLGYQSCTISMVYTMTGNNVITVRGKELSGTAETLAGSRLTVVRVG